MNKSILNTSLFAVMTNYGQLDALRSQNAVLAETLKNTELRNKISGVDKTSTGQPGPNPGGTTGVQSSSYPSSFASPSALVQMVSGIESKMTAQISLPDGSPVNVRVGSNIAGLGIVKSISMNEVMIADKKRIFSLPFASDSSSALGVGGMRVPSMSPLPPGMMPGGVR
jgi:type IV pilus biogenesis protein PilP